MEKKAINSFRIVVDSACDISAELLEKWSVKCVNLSFIFDDDETPIANNQISASEFYQQLRDGRMAKTSAANTEMFRTLFQTELEAGNDILYLGFSSALSATYSSAYAAAVELRNDYPEHDIFTVDTLAASAGFGLLLYLAVQEKNKGASVAEVAKFAENMKQRICHWFTVDTLEYLKKGGRISSATALLGGVLNIKPLMSVDKEGHLIGVRKVRGRKNAINELVCLAADIAVKSQDYPVYISHGDCLEDAQMLADRIKELCNIEVALITDVGPVIGAHSGPGTLALFFVGDYR